MKKSEMIGLMWEYVQKVECDYDRYMGEHNVEELLDLIEKAGMLPPDRSGCGCNDPECCGGKDYNWTKEDTP